MTTAVRRGAKQSQEDRVAASDAGPSARFHDPHANTQLVQSLPRRVVREAPLRPAGEAAAQGAQPQEQAAGVRVANVVRELADSAAVLGAGLVFAYGAKTFYNHSIQGGSTADPSYDDRLALGGAKTMLGATVAYGGFKAIEYLADGYIRAQTRGQKAQRARELGTTEACLDAALEMVSTPDANNPGPDMNVGEQIALARDLLHLITVERSRLPLDLWNAASGVGGDAHRLVTQLLQAARARAVEEASTSSAD
ncbi:type III secretion system effector XopAV [Xanthomonas vasicola]|uniref:Uncharacterized protein n=1 Tax=Xanthomonas vasicola TaxID=56459 RepID=A0ABD7S858_XANVA|nr:type III secretion system effector XopAV [Xanthomonas vasicola]AZR24764.1 hypothetical protein NX81_006425 [Xanthomonas vasicola]KGR41788.1 hypothetical protein NX04_13125 [Xanthomonas vasicola]KGR48347.1 hypothetical protein NX05_00490 [Xanthomonas vasicola]KGR59111.1 hypothetical protein NX79_16265 [Xanthomonas vasicola]MDO6985990.1 type III secretion system effector XopAV [Xanthomonas vasicola]